MGICSIAYVEFPWSRKMRKILLLLFLTSCAGGQAPGGVSSKMLNVADAALHSENPELALQVSQTVLNENPGDQNAEIHEAAALYALGRHDEAQAIYEKLYTAHPTTTVAAGLAKCLIRNNPRRAAVLLENAIKKRPDNVSLLTNFGIAQDLLGNHSAAQAIYRKALELDPAQIPAQVDLALSLAFLGNFDQAKARLEPLAVAQNSTIRIRQDYGAVLALGGHLNQGTDVLEADLPLAKAQEASLAYEALASSDRTTNNKLWR
jgi:Flp pilus assembly protein TadD